MARRPRALTPGAPLWEPPPCDWEISTEFRVNGRILTPGSEVSIRGERGRFRFLRHVRRPNGVEWLDFLGGANGYMAFRAFRPERVKRVHRLAKTRANVGEV